MPMILSVGLFSRVKIVVTFTYFVCLSGYPWEREIGRESVTDINIYDSVKMLEI